MMLGVKPKKTNRIVALAILALVSKACCTRL